MSSISLNRSPSSSAATSALSRSSPGCSRFHAITSSRYALMLSIASNEARISSRVRIGIERLHDRARPLAELRAVAALGDAQHLRDDDERQRERERRDEIDIGARCPGHVEMLVDELLHPGPQCFDHAGREHLRHQSAQAVVVGRIEVEHVVRAAFAALGQHLCDVGIDRDRDRRHVPLLDAEARVAQHAVDVVVAEERERPDRAVVHRVLLPHQAVLRVGVVEESGLERVEHHRQVAGIGRFARRHPRDRTPGRDGARRDIGHTTGRTTGRREGRT